MKRVELLLARLIGLDVASFGVDAVQSVVRSRMAATGIGDPGAYAALVEMNPAERTLLVETIVVSETWFFREPASFELLRQFIAGRVTRYRHKPVRILSVPCATGEEPYSVAMTLLGIGLPPTSVLVDAVDVSDRALAVAERGVYGKISFRGGREPSEEFFEQQPGGWRVKADVRACVRLSRGNVLEPAFMGDTRYDVVLCRNLLIYLDRASRRVVLDNVRRLLAADGILFAGHAEALEFMNAGFVRAGEPGSFAFTTGKDGNAPSVESGRRGAPGGVRPRATASHPPRKAAEKEPHSRRPRDSKDQTAPHPDETLAPAPALADRGELTQALAACERHLKRQGATAEAYSLLGVIAQAGGDAASARLHFDRALYLDPDHHEALVHLALLQRQLGQSRAAEHLDRRAERSARRKVSS